MAKKGFLMMWLIFTIYGSHLGELLQKYEKIIAVVILKWAASSEFVSSSIPSWQILTAHAQPFRGARDLAFCLKVPLDSLLVWVSSGGSGETAWMRRLAWTFAARIGDKYQIRLTQPKFEQCDNTFKRCRQIVNSVGADQAAPGPREASACC